MDHGLDRRAMLPLQALAVLEADRSLVSLPEGQAFAPLGRALEAQAQVVRACVEPTSELGFHAIEPTRPRGQRRIDGVGRPKFDSTQPETRHAANSRKR